MRAFQYIGMYDYREIEVDGKTIKFRKFQPVEVSDEAVEQLSVFPDMEEVLDYDPDEGVFKSPPGFDREGLIQTATRLGITVDKRWSDETLNSKIIEAESATDEDEDEDYEDDE